MNRQNSDQVLRRLKYWYWFCGCVAAAYFINFLAFVAVASYLGGDALNGKIENGHYYLWGNKHLSDRKDYTEVTQSVFYYSKWHAYSVVICVFLCMTAVFAGNRLKIRISDLKAAHLTHPDSGVKRGL